MNGHMKRMERRQRPRRPRPLPGFAITYNDDQSRVPDMIRVSFEDGTTATYKRDWQQPAPLIMKNITIIREWQGYTPPELREG